VTTSTAKRNASAPENGKRWEKGVSGNPGGMTENQRKLKALCKEDADVAVKFMVALVKDTKASNRDRFAAASYIYDQAYGKARQSLHHTGELTLTHEEALSALAEDIESAGETTTH